MKIRQEQTTDYAEIYELVKSAFATAEVTDGDEQDYVNNLRKSDKYLPELALVAEKDGRLIGHIMLTSTQINCAENTFTELLLSPLCVALSRRRTGVGAALVNKSFRLAKEMGYRAVFVVGDPQYYTRFGFKCVAEFGIVNEGDIPEQFVMAHELITGALQDKQGTVKIV